MRIPGAVHPSTLPASSATARREAGPLPRVSGEGAGVLTVELGDSGRGRVEFTLKVPSRGERETSFSAHVALLGGGFSSRVTAGENSGETLNHEFVALAVVDRALVADGKALRAAFTLPSPMVPGAPRRALIAWVTPRGALAPVQAAGGWLNH